MCFPVREGPAARFYHRLLRRYEGYPLCARPADSLSVSWVCRSSFVCSFKASLAIVH
jgi:hypothetical protein